MFTVGARVEFNSCQGNHVFRGRVVANTEDGYYVLFRGDHEDKSRHVRTSRLRKCNTEESSWCGGGAA